MKHRVLGCGLIALAAALAADLALFVPDSSACPPGFKPKPGVTSPMVVERDCEPVGQPSSPPASIPSTAPPPSVSSPPPSEPSEPRRPKAPPTVPPSVGREKAGRMLQERMRGDDELLVPPRPQTKPRRPLDDDDAIKRLGEKLREQPPAPKDAGEGVRVAPADPCAGEAGDICVEVARELERQKQEANEEARERLEEIEREMQEDRDRIDRERERRRQHPERERNAQQQEDLDKQRTELDEERDRLDEERDRLEQRGENREQRDSDLRQQDRDMRRGPPPDPNCRSAACRELQRQRAELNRERVEDMRAEQRLERAEQQHDRAEREWRAEWTDLQNRLDRGEGLTREEHQARVLQQQGERLRREGQEAVDRYWRLRQGAERDGLTPREVDELRRLHRDLNGYSRMRQQGQQMVNDAEGMTEHIRETQGGTFDGWSRYSGEELRGESTYMGRMIEEVRQARARVGQGGPQPADRTLGQSRLEAAERLHGRAEAEMDRHYRDRVSLQDKLDLVQRQLDEARWDLQRARASGAASAEGLRNLQRRVERFERQLDQTDRAYRRTLHQETRAEAEFRGLDVLTRSISQHRDADAVHNFVNSYNRSYGDTIDAQGRLRPDEVRRQVHALQQGFDRGMAQAGQLGRELSALRGAREAQAAGEARLPGPERRGLGTEDLGRRIADTQSALDAAVRGLGDLGVRISVGRDGQPRVEEVTSPLARAYAGAVRNLQRRTELEARSQRTPEEEQELRRLRGEPPPAVTEAPRPAAPRRESPRTTEVAPTRPRRPPEEVARDLARQQAEGEALRRAAEEGGFARWQEEQARLRQQRIAELEGASQRSAAEEQELRRLRGREERERQWQLARAERAREREERQADASGQRQEREAAEAERRREEEAARGRESLRRFEVREQERMRREQVEAQERQERERQLGEAEGELARLGQARRERRLTVEEQVRERELRVERDGLRIASLKDRVDVAVRRLMDAQAAGESTEQAEAELARLRAELRSASELFMRGAVERSRAEARLMAERMERPRREPRGRRGAEAGTPGPPITNAEAEAYLREHQPGQSIQEWRAARQERRQTEESRVTPWEAAGLSAEEWMRRQVEEAERQRSEALAAAQHRGDEERARRWLRRFGRDLGSMPRSSAPAEGRQGEAASPVESQIEGRVRPEGAPRERERRALEPAGEVTAEERAALRQTEALLAAARERLRRESEPPSQAERERVRQEEAREARRLLEALLEAAVRQEGLSADARTQFLEELRRLRGGQTRSVEELEGRVAALEGRVARDGTAADARQARELAGAVQRARERAEEGTFQRTATAGERLGRDVRERLEGALRNSELPPSYRRAFLELLAALGEGGAPLAVAEVDRALERLLETARQRGEVRPPGEGLPWDPAAEIRELIRRAQQAEQERRQSAQAEVTALAAELERARQEAARTPAPARPPAPAVPGERAPAPTPSAERPSLIDRQAQRAEEELAALAQRQAGLEAARLRLEASRERGYVGEDAYRARRQAIEEEVQALGLQHLRARERALEAQRSQALRDGRATGTIDQELSATREEIRQRAQEEMARLAAAIQRQRDASLREAQERVRETERETRRRILPGGEGGWTDADARAYLEEWCQRRAQIAELEALAQRTPAQESLLERLRAEARERGTPSGWWESEMRRRAPPPTPAEIAEAEAAAAQLRAMELATHLRARILAFVSQRTGSAVPAQHPLAEILTVVAALYGTDAVERFLDGYRPPPPERAGQPEALAVLQALFETTVIPAALAEGPLKELEARQAYVTVLERLLADPESRRLWGLFGEEALTPLQQMLVGQVASLREAVVAHARRSEVAGDWAGEMAATVTALQLLTRPVEAGGVAPADPESQALVRAFLDRLTRLWDEAIAAAGQTERAQALEAALAGTLSDLALRISLWTGRSAEEDAEVRDLLARAGRLYDQLSIAERQRTILLPEQDEAARQLRAASEAHALSAGRLLTEAGEWAQAFRALARAGGSAEVLLARVALLERVRARSEQFSHVEGVEWDRAAGPGGRDHLDYLYREALTALTGAGVDAETRSAAYLRLATLAEEAGAYDEARRHLEATSQAQPDRPEVRLERLRFDLARGTANDPEVVVREVIAIFPDWARRAPALLYLAAELQRQRPGEATEMVEALLRDAAQTQNPQAIVSYTEFLLRRIREIEETQRQGEDATRERIVLAEQALSHLTRLPPEARAAFTDVVASLTAFARNLRATDEIGRQIESGSWLNLEWLDSAWSLFEAALQGGRVDLAVAATRQFLGARHIRYTERFEFALRSLAVLIAQRDLLASDTLRQQFGEAIDSIRRAIVDAAERREPEVIARLQEAAEAFERIRRGERPESERDTFQSAWDNALAEIAAMERARLQAELLTLPEADRLGRVNQVLRERNGQVRDREEQILTGFSGLGEAVDTNRTFSRALARQEAQLAAARVRRDAIEDLAFAGPGSRQEALDWIFSELHGRREEGRRWQTGGVVERIAYWERAVESTSDEVRLNRHLHLRHEPANLDYLLRRRLQIIWGDPELSEVQRIERYRQIREAEIRYYQRRGEAMAPVFASPRMDYGEYARGQEELFRRELTDLVNRAAEPDMQNPQEFFGLMARLYQENLERGLQQYQEHLDTPRLRRGVVQMYHLYYSDFLERFLGEDPRNWRRVAAAIEVQMTEVGDLSAALTQASLRPVEELMPRWRELLEARGFIRDGRYTIPEDFRYDPTTVAETSAERSRWDDILNAGTFVDALITVLLPAAGAARTTALLEGAVARGGFVPLERMAAGGAARQLAAQVARAAGRTAVEAGFFTVYSRAAQTLLHPEMLNEPGYWSLRALGQEYVHNLAALGILRGFSAFSREFGREVSAQFGIGATPFSRLGLQQIRDEALRLLGGGAEFTAEAALLTGLDGALQGREITATSFLESALFLAQLRAGGVIASYAVGTGEAPRGPLIREQALDNYRRIRSQVMEEAARRAGREEPTLTPAEIERLETAWSDAVRPRGVWVREVTLERYRRVLSEVMEAAARRTGEAGETEIRLTADEIRRLEAARAEVAQAGIRGALDAVDALQRRHGVPVAAGPRPADVVRAIDNPARFIRERYGDEARHVARAWEIAVEELGTDVEGIAGSFATGGARLGRWPFLTASDAARLDKVQEDLPPELVEILPPESRGLYELRRRLGELPSDLDVITRTTDVRLLDRVRERIYEETGVLVEFVEPFDAVTGEAAPGARRARLQAGVVVATPGNLPPMPRQELCNTCGVATARGVIERATGARHSERDLVLWSIQQHRGYGVSIDFQTGRWEGGTWPRGMVELLEAFGVRVRVPFGREFSAPDLAPAGAVSVPRRMDAPPGRTIAPDPRLEAQVSRFTVDDAARELREGNQVLAVVNYRSDVRNATHWVTIEKVGSGRILVDGQVVIDGPYVIIGDPAVGHSVALSRADFETLWFPEATIIALRPDAPLPSRRTASRAPGGSPSQEVPPAGRPGARPGAWRPGDDVAPIVARYFAERGEPIPPLHTTTEEALGAIRASGFLEGPQRGAGWSHWGIGMLREGNVAIRVKPELLTAEARRTGPYVEFVTSGEGTGLVARFWPDGKPAGATEGFRTYVPAQYLEFFNPISLTWRPVPAPRLGRPSSVETP